MKPTERQMERAVTALVPYVKEWGLPLNPEQRYELAGAVLEHFDSDASFDAIDAAERERLAGYARGHPRRPSGLSVDDGSSAADGDPSSEPLSLLRRCGSRDVGNYG
jgi:hypothetical protein